MAAKGKGKGKPPAPAPGAKSAARRPEPKAWPKVRTFDPEVRTGLGASALDVDTCQEPFHTRRLVFEARNWADTLEPRPVPEELLSGLGLPEEDETAAWLASLRGSTKAPGALAGQPAADVDVQVVRLSGETLHFTVAPMESVQDLKGRIELQCQIPAAWQVLLLAGNDGKTIELLDASEVQKYCEGSRLELNLQVFHSRDLCLKAVCGPGKHGAMLELLELDGTTAACYVGVLNFQNNDLRGTALQLLLKGLEAAEAAQLLERALARGDKKLQRQAAMAVARRFCTEPAVLSKHIGAASEASMVGRLLRHLEGRSLLPARPTQRAFRRVTFKNEALAMARRTLAGHLCMAKRLRPGWMYQEFIPCRDFADSVTKCFEWPAELERAAADLGISLETLKTCVEFRCLNQHGNPLGPTSLNEQVFLVVSICNVAPFLRAEPDGVADDMGEPDLWAAVAELPNLPAEHTRLALECAALVAGPGHSRTLDAAAWQAGHRDAAVRDQALEAILRVAQAADLQRIHALLETWWSSDVHVKRIRAEADKFFSKGDFGTRLWTC